MSIRSDPSSTTLLGTLAVTTAAALWGLWGLVISLAGIAGPRAACVVLFAIGLSALPTLPRRIIRDRTCYWALLATGFGNAANSLLYFEALSRGPQAVAVLSHYLAPVLVALLSPLALGARPTRQTWLALPVSIVGLALILGDGLFRSGDTLTTAMLGGASAIFYGGQIVVQKRFSDRLAPSELLVWHALIGGFLLLPLALSLPAPSWSSMGILALAGAVFGGFGGSLFLWGLGRIPAAKVGVLTYVEPLVAVLVGLLYFGEAMAPLAPVGAFLILGAGWVVARE